jgi:hypothetical protein
MDTDIPENKWFYFKHGKRASNIAELKTVLDSISESEFKHHVDYDKNDFASWVENVFEEKKLAKNMREAGDKEGIIVLLDDFLSNDNEPPIPPTPTYQEHKEHSKRHRKKASMAEDKNLIIEPGKELSEDEPSEKELSENDIKLLVDDAMQVFDTPKDDRADKVEIWHEDEKENEGEKDETNYVGAAEEDAGEEIEEEEAKPMHRPILEMEKPSLEKEKGAKKEKPHKFMVEEFLYGFILGLIFGLIMLGVILQLKIV